MKKEEILLKLLFKLKIGLMHTLRLSCMSNLALFRGETIEATAAILTGEGIGEGIFKLC